MALKSVDVEKLIDEDDHSARLIWELFRKETGQPERFFCLMPSGLGGIAVQYAVNRRYQSLGVAFVHEAGSVVAHVIRHPLHF